MKLISTSLILIFSLHFLAAIQKAVLNIPYRKGDKWGICNEYKEFYVKPVYDEINPLDADLFIACMKNRYGVINARGQTLIPFDYEKIFTRDGKILHVKKRGREGILTKEGDVIIPPKYFELTKVNDDLYRIRSRGYGYMDSKMNILIPPVYPELQIYRDSLCAAFNGKKWGFINIHGETVISFIYEIAWWFVSGKAAVKLNGRYGLIDKKENILLPFEYDRVDILKNEIVILEKDKKYGILDKNLKAITALNLDIHPERNENYIKIKKEAYAMINAEGDTILPFIYQDIQFPAENLFPVKFEGKWGFVNEKNEIAIPIVYKGVRSFSEELAAVDIGRGWGFINKNNEVVIPYSFKDAANFKNGTAKVINHKQQVSRITKDGKLLFPFRYNAISEFKYGIAEIRIWDYSTGKERIFAGYVDENFNEYWEN